MIKNENGLKVAKLIHVSVDNGKTGNSNKYYNMEELSDGTFRVEYGRVGRDPKIETYPISFWDKKYNEKTSPKKGYKDVTDLMVETLDTGTGGEVVDIKDSVVKKLVNDLMNFANSSIKQNYTVTQEQVTQAQIDEAQKLLSEIVKEIKIGVNLHTLNSKLIQYYIVIPRTMKDVRNHLFNPIIDKESLTRANNLISKEQDTLDSMGGQVQLIKQQREANKLNEGVSAKQINILDQIGVSMKHITDVNVIKKVKDLMGSDANLFVNVYEVVNNKTQVNFDKEIRDAKNKKTMLLWHGSRNQNWFNIIQTGLLIRPSNAVHTGSMFDDGIYFASKFRKSLGYTSLSGSYWAGGNQNKAYLALYDVHMGNELHIHRHDSSCYTISKKVKAEGYDSVFAHSGADLRNDEMIVYSANKCTVKYLVEVKQ